MTNNGFFNYNRKEALKKWEPIPNLDLPTETIQYYNYKIQVSNGELIKYPINTIESAVQDVVWDKTLKRNEIDDNFLKYLALLHMNHLFRYIEHHGFMLKDVKPVIKEILNEIINNEVDESYYLNTIEIYQDISGFGYEANIYDLIDQAIKRENWRMIYYLVFYEDEKITDRMAELDCEPITANTVC